MPLGNQKIKNPDLVARENTAGAPPDVIGSDFGAPLGTFLPNVRSCAPGEGCNVDQHRCVRRSSAGRGCGRARHRYRLAGADVAVAGFPTTLLSLLFAVKERLLKLQLSPCLWI